MKKKLTAAILSVVMLLMSGSVFAAGTETAEESKYSGEYGAFEQMAKYVAERYIDDSLTEEEIMKQGLSKLLENNDPLLVQLLKSMLESLDDYSEFYTPEEYKAFQDKLNQNFEVHIEIVTVSVCTFFNAFFDEWDKIACAVRSSVHERRKNLKFP